MSSSSRLFSLVLSCEWRRPVSASTDINVIKLAELFVDKVEGVCAATSNVPPPYVRQAASPPTSVKFLLRKCGKRWWVRLSKVPFSTKTVKGVGWRLETIGVTHPLWKISGYATACNFLKCSSNTLIPINYLMWSNIYSASLPTILEDMQMKYKFKQQTKTHGCDENDYIAKSALQ